MENNILTYADVLNLWYEGHKTQVLDELTDYENDFSLAGFSKYLLDTGLSISERIIITDYLIKGGD